MKNRIILFTIFLLSSLLAVSICSANEKKEPLTLPELMTGMAKYEKKEVSLVSTIAGACNSGCKIWVADGAYKEGEPIALVWAKDKAFTFKTNATGQKVLLKGYAVGKYIDLCAIEKETKSSDKKAENDCNPIIETETGKKQLSSITFFATSIDYL
ncbi:MAG: hypothetical protein GY699_13640 [Desulfobacteraceae bacterium]|nr:hypothetical protein [Desulfobacteraceae bacterium]